MKAKSMTLAAGVLLVGSVLVLALSNYSRGGAREEAAYQVNLAALEGQAELDDGLEGQHSAEQAGEVVSMIAEWTGPLFAPPGWIYVKEEVLQDGLDLGVLPDGTPIPDDYVFESWYLLGKGGFVEAGVSRMTDMDGNEVQVSVYEDSTWTNITYDLTSVEGPFKPNLDHGLTADLTSSGHERISGFDEKEVTHEGKPAREVTTYEDFSPPVHLEGSSAAIAQIVKHAVFDRGDGALKSYETVYRTEGGEDVTISIVTVLAAERIDAPPAEVLDLFQERPQ